MYLSPFVYSSPPLHYCTMPMPPVLMNNVYFILTNLITTCADLQGYWPKERSQVLPIYGSRASLTCAYRLFIEGRAPGLFDKHKLKVVRHESWREYGLFWLTSQGKRLILCGITVEHRGTCLALIFVKLPVRKHIHTEDIQCCNYPKLSAYGFH